jgi:hypothetical protein
MLAIRSSNLEDRNLQNKLDFLIYYCMTCSVPSIPKETNISVIMKMELAIINIYD